MMWGVWICATCPIFNNRKDDKDMKHVDRLMIKAKEFVNRYTEKLVQAFIYPDGDIWVADGRLWDGKKGSGTTRVVCECATMDEAIESLDALSEKHPNDKPVTIIIDDMDDTDG